MGQVLMGWVINGVNYDEFIASPEWAAIRKERLEIDNYSCRGCGRPIHEIGLEVHHIRYDNFGGDEDVENDLTTFCTDCHPAITAVTRRLRYSKKEYRVDTIRLGTVRAIGAINVERKNLSVDRIDGVNHAQRGISKPNEQMGAFNENDFI